jgi:hypothetical protein
MKTPLTALVLILVVSNFYLLSTSRLRALIRVAAFQGIVLGFLPFITQAKDFSQHTLILGIGGMALKGVVIPVWNPVFGIGVLGWIRDWGHGTFPVSPYGLARDIHGRIGHFPYRRPFPSAFTSDWILDT